MKIPQLIALIVGFVVMVVVQRQGTEQIMAQDPPDPFWALFPYYLSLVAAMSVSVGGVNYVIRNYFGVYEAPKNT